MFRSLVESRLEPGQYECVFLSFKDSLTAAYLDLGLCAGLVDVGRVVQLTTTVACAG